MLDVNATRARLRNAVTPPPAPATLARSVPSGYRDVDMTAPPEGRLARRVGPAPNAARWHVNDSGLTPRSQPAGFLDLDDAPLTLSGDTNAKPVPPSENHRIEETDTPVVSDLAPAPVAEAPVLLDPPLMRRIIFHATANPGTVPPFGKTQPNLGGEGLRYGIGRFTQASGDLGRLLTAMKDMDPDAFDNIFGPEAEALLAVTNAPLPVEVTDSELPNMAPVGGQLLWSPEWIARFKEAAQHPAFQDAQYMVTAHTTLLPMLDFARNMGLYSEKALSILAERVIQLGVEPAKEFIVIAAGPLQTEALKRAALLHVSNEPTRATLSDFQATRGLPDTAGRLDPDTHAALFAALRGSIDSPVPLPSPEMMLDQIVIAAEASPLPGRVAEIRANQTLWEAPLSQADPVME